MLVKIIFFSLLTQFKLQSQPRLQTATFIKRVFAHTFRDSEVSTIERKMSHTESECRIKLDKKIALAES